MTSGEPGDETQTERVLRFMEENADEDFGAVEIGQALGLDQADVATILDYMLVLRPEVSEPAPGVYRFSPLDDLYDRRFAARDHAVEIVRLLS